MQNRYLISHALGRRRFADALIDYLITLGVEYLFGMPAESVNSLVHAASRRPEITVVCARHESAAALMAAGYARASGRLGVCFGTAGPGATNLVAGVHEAFLGRVPLLAISGQVPLATIGRGGFQEIDSTALFAACSASSVQINAPGQFERFARSCTTALHQATACHVAIPGDVLYGPIDSVDAAVRAPAIPARTPASKEDLDAVFAILGAGDLAVVSSCTERAQHAAAQRLAALLDCPWRSVDDTTCFGTPLTAENVVVVGRSSPLLTHLVAPQANLIELTDRLRIDTTMPYIRQVVCDVETSLQDVVATLHERGLTSRHVQEPAGPPVAHRTRWVFSDLAVGDDGDASAERFCGDVVSRSLAGIPGAALPLAIGAALAGHRSVALTDHEHVNSFVAELATLADLGADVLVEFRVDDHQSGWATEQLGRAMGIAFRTATASGGAEAATHVAQLSDNHGPTLIALPQNATAEATPVSGSAERRPGEQSLVTELTRNLGTPVQISEACAQLVPGFAAAPGSAQLSTHPQAPSMSAAALRKSGAPSAGTLATSGAALLLQLNGIYDAALDGARIVVATVEAGVWNLDASRLLAEVTAARYVADDPATATLIVRRACAAASAPGAGVVHLHVTRRALNLPWATPRSSPLPVPEFQRGPEPDPTTILEAITALRDAPRVAIIAGRGAAGATGPLDELRRALNASLHLTMGGDSVASDPELRSQGRIGGSGDRQAFQHVANADVLLMVGVSNRGAAFSQQAPGRVIAVNLDPHAMLRLSDRDIGVLGDATSAVEAMVAALAAPTPPVVSAPGLDAPVAKARVGPVAKARVGQNLRHGLTSLSRRRSERAPLRASRLVQVINTELAQFEGSSTVCADVGVNTLWVYRHITAMTRSIWSASFGTMGFAVPAAIAAARNPVDNSSARRIALAVAGDGGTSITMGQIRSAAALSTPLIIVVINNLALAAIKFESEIMGWADHGSAIPDINFADYAVSVGVPARRVSTVRDFRMELRSAIATGGPYLIDARCVLNDAPVQAGSKTWRQVAGFFLAWSREGGPGLATFAEVTRAVIRDSVDSLFDSNTERGRAVSAPSASPAIRRRWSPRR